MTFLAFLAGLLAGSFLNVCIHRWPAGESVVKPRSRCPHCEQPVAWYDNVPLASFVWLRGRCRFCRERISWRYPAVELLNAAVYAGLIAKFGWQPFTLKCMLFGSMMLVLIFTDLEHYILPDEVTIGGGVIGFVLSLVILIPPGATQIFWLLADAAPSPRTASFAESATAAVFFGGFLWVTGEIYYRVRGVEGLGLGDVKMAAMIGAFWGVGPTLLVLIVGSLIGALSGTLIVLIGGKRWNYELPYGSYLGAAAIATTFFGDELIDLYWGAVGGIAG